MDFTRLGLRDALVQGLAKQGITAPAPIQTQGIPPILNNEDVFLNAETGTGKTLAFLLPLFERIDCTVKDLQVVILAPTHELAMQIHEQSTTLARNSGIPVRSQALIGSAAVKRQIEGLKKKPHLVVGSAGRIQHLITLKKLKLQKVRAVVLDEMDRLLVDESLQQIRRILAMVPRERQMIFCSATRQPKSLAEAQSLCPGLQGVSTAANRIAPNIEHLYCVGEERDKFTLLRKLIHAQNPERALVFLHRNEDVEELVTRLAFHKINVVGLHGGMDKLERKNGLDGFRRGKSRVLVASDVAARGLDISGVTHVYNLNAPSSGKDYLHRVGRTGRAGVSGCAVTLLTDPELRLVRRYEQELDLVMTRISVRQGRVILPRAPEHRPADT
ncbi:MAG TPA: DEAD/DEAH box helicase [Desulfomicrobiaceae bacterium]|nr:DEAD/DEAH box helicase [Desulfomicrobiaceae bacterium]